MFPEVPEDVLVAGVVIVVEFNARSDPVALLGSWETIGLCVVSSSSGSTSSILLLVLQGRFLPLCSRTIVTSRSQEERFNMSCV